MRRAKPPTQHVRIRRLTKTALLLAAALACSPPADPKPNIVLVVLDTTRADALSAYGNARPTTPRLDELARSGARFERAYATDFWTLPSHASLLTGLHPSEHGATSESDSLRTSVDTLAEQLAAAGWRTGAFVSNPWLSRERGFAQGFELYHEAWTAAPPGADEYLADRAGLQTALAWMDQRAPGPARPFFAFFNWNSAHLPYQPEPLGYVDLFPAPFDIDRVAALKQINGGWAVLAGALALDPSDLRMMRNLYESEVARLDGLVGQLVDGLAARGLLDDTLLIVTADHGEAFGEHGLIDHLFSMYESTLRVPLIIHFPARFRAGDVRGELVSLVDIVPTILDVAGIADRAVQEAPRSLADPDRIAATYVVAENERPLHALELMKASFPEFDMQPYDHRLRMIRSGDHKLIWREGRGVELYDLAADPQEQHDLATADPVTRDRLLALLEAWMDEHPVTPESPKSILESQDPRAVEQLRALGYVD